jgi:hypothetical protein
MKPQYWFHMARDFREAAHIEVRGPDKKWVAFLYVVDCGINWARCIKVGYFDLMGAEEPVEVLPFIVKWRGPQGGKFAVIRLSDNKILQDGFSDKGAAYAWGATSDLLKG